MGSSVLLNVSRLRISDESERELELAILAGSILVLLGDDDTSARDLALVLSGRISPSGGGVTLGEEELDITDHGCRGRVEYIPEDPIFPRGMKVTDYLLLASSWTGHSRKKRGEILQQLVEWASLEELLETAADSLPAGERQRVALAAACLSLPEVFVVQGSMPHEMHELLESLCQGGCAAVISVGSVRDIPAAADRIALCGPADVENVVGYRQLFEACSEMMRIRVSFFPPLPRAVMESLPGSRDLLAVKGGYEFHHPVLSTAVNNLVNLARANSRQIAELEIRPPAAEELIQYFRAEEEGEEVDLFWGEDLDI